ncbi:four-carbon acid sugar kinase family protein [Hydrogenophaga sp.]|uniref:four-carbon acid sugar kinase family protein n=1 Tax=Hydrogenophaga sp. TaxID=1904254 RepID=UPI00262992C3|nr:four-carbon acid sugar kinase family protein [Hydrogenophaga sp.]
MNIDTNHRVAIVADDLTSAADAAGPFVVRGLTAIVGRGRPPRLAGTVVSVDCGSRSAARAEAAARVAALTASLAGREVLYKTVDSTLRGHVTAELEACFKASGRSLLVLAPAFPAAGRTTVEGIQLVDGIPVAESVYGRDPVHPARHSSLAELVPNCIQNVFLLDAATEEELDAKIAALPEPESILWAGSPGMALALARRLTPSETHRASVRHDAENVLVVVGSANPHSHRQAKAIAHSTGVTLVCGPVAREDDPDAVLRRIALEAEELLLRKRFDALIVSGGDTMDAILDRLGVREFEVHHELAPGFPLCRAILDSGRPLWLAMKAGGFGDDDALRCAVAKLQRVAPLSAGVSA